MKKSANSKSTYEKEMKDPKFRKLFEKDYRELVTSEICLSKAAQDEVSTDRLESLAGILTGLNEIGEGKTSSAKSVFRRMRGRYNIPKPS